MNVSEGTRRMRRAGQLIFLIAIVALALSIARHVLWLVFPLLWIAFPGASLWLAGWIVQGFAKEEPRKDHSRSLG